MKSLLPTFYAVILFAPAVAGNAWADSHALEAGKSGIKAGEGVSEVLLAPGGVSARQVPEFWKKGALAKLHKSIQKEIGKDAAKGTFAKKLIRNKNKIKSAKKYLGYAGYAADAYEIGGDMLKNGITKENVKKSTKTVLGVGTGIAAGVIGGPCGPALVACALAANWALETLKDKAVDWALETLKDKAVDEAVESKAHQKRTARDRHNDQKRYGFSHTAGNRLSQGNIRRGRETVAAKKREAEAKFQEAKDRTDGQADGFNKSTAKSDAPPPDGPPPLPLLDVDDDLSNESCAWINFEPWVFMYRYVCIDMSR